MKMRNVLITGLTCSVMAVTATTSVCAATGDPIVVGAQPDWVTMDPGLCYETFASTVMRACYDTLYYFNPEIEGPQEDLATGVTYSEDGLTVTITIREDVVFASGNPLTAKDVQFSIMRTKNLKGNPSFICNGIDSVDVVDDYTVQFNLNTPDSAFTSKLAHNSLSIIDSELAKEYGATDAEDAAETDTARDFFDEGNSLGSGPYSLESYIPDEELTLIANENYYDTSSSIPEIVIQTMDDANTQMMALSRNDIQIALNLNQDTYSELDGTEGIELSSPFTMTMGFLFMNMDESIGGPVSNPLVQQAIRYAIDYDGVQQLIGDGAVTPVSYIQRGLLGSLDPRDVSNYTDLEKAKSLLEEAGYADGFEIDFVVCTLAPEGNPLPDVAVKLADDLSKIGITLNIITEDWSGGFADEYRGGKLAISYMYWKPDYTDPNAQLEFLPGGIVGLRTGWTEEMNPELAEMKTDILTEMDQDARVELLHEMQEATAESGPIIPLVQYPKYLGYSSELTGVTFSDNYRVDIRAIDWAE